MNTDVRELRLALAELVGHPIGVETRLTETAAEVRAAAAELAMLRAQQQEPDRG